MPRGQDLSAYQRKIVDRYYQNRDTIMLSKLGELVSELALLGGGTARDAKAEAKRAKLWKSAELAMTNLGVPPERVQAIVRAGDVEALARVVAGKV